jgi:hypothetical protein
MVAVGGVVLGDGLADGMAVAPTRVTEVASPALLAAALMTATPATDPAMRMPPVAATVAMMLALFMVEPFR